MSIKNLFQEIQDKLRQAVKEGSWTLVQQVLKEIGGEDDFVVSPPAHRDSLPRQKEKEDFRVTHRPTSKRSNNTNNKFNPDEYKGQLNELEKYVNDNVTRTPRDRPHYSSITVSCLVCSKTSQVNPTLVNDRNSYTCDRCISKRIV